MKKKIEIVLELETELSNMDIEESFKRCLLLHSPFNNAEQKMEIQHVKCLGSNNWQPPVGYD